jgi:hypothetical protein
MNSEPLGRDWQHPYILPDLARAILVARQDQQKIWAKMIGWDRETHTYEVWPGGRGVRWPDEMLERRRKRAEIQPARRGPKEPNWALFDAGPARP